MRSMITFFHCFYVYVSCLPLDKRCGSKPAINVFEGVCLRMWWAAEVPRLLGSILGSLTEITAGEQLYPCMVGSVSSDQTQREEAERERKKKLQVFPFSFSQPHQVGRAVALLRYSLSHSNRTKSSSWVHGWAWEIKSWVFMLASSRTVVHASSQHLPCWI